MNNALKGAFLSGLFFPGLGQIMLKRYKLGIALMAVVFASMVVIIAQAVRVALTILEKIEQGGGTVDFSTITDIAIKTSGKAGSFMLNFSFFLILLCWIIGIIDAYLTGKNIDS